MKKGILFATAFIFVWIFTGCAGSHCVKIGGSYQGITGETEYCWSKGKTESVGAPVLEGVSGDLLGLTEEQVQKLLDKLKDKGKELGILETKTPFQILVEQVR